MGIRDRNANRLLDETISDCCELIKELNGACRSGNRGANAARRHKQTHGRRSGPFQRDVTVGIFLGKGFAFRGKLRSSTLPCPEREQLGPNFPIDKVQKVRWRGSHLEDWRHVKYTNLRAVKKEKTFYDEYCIVNNKQYNKLYHHCRSNMKTRIMEDLHENILLLHLRVRYELRMQYFS